MPAAIHPYGPPDVEVPRGYCLCGCGERTPPARRTDPQKGYVKGEPVRYLQYHHLRRRLDSYIVDPETGCWLWTGTVGPDGYGRIYRAACMEGAHRAVYRHVRGPIPEGMELDHVCHTEDTACAGGATCLHRRCVNPEHLEVVTPRENRVRARLRNTHCIHGHPFDEANTYIDSTGKRVCRTCVARRQREYKVRLKEARAA